jgi:hypothetical protein
MSRQALGTGCAVAAGLLLVACTQGQPYARTLLQEPAAVVLNVTTCDLAVSTTDSPECTSVGYNPVFDGYYAAQLQPGAYVMRIMFSLQSIVSGHERSFIR